MRLDVRCKTELEGLSLFWPSRVLEDVQALSSEERESWFADQSSKRRLIHFSFDLDNDPEPYDFYRLAVFVEEDIPADIGHFLIEQTDLGAVEVPDEAGWFGGSKGISGDPEKSDEVNPVEIPPGEYRAFISVFDPPYEFKEIWERALLSPEGHRARNQMGNRTSCGCLLIPGGIVAGATIGWTPWVFAAIAIGIAALVLSDRGLGEAVKELEKATKAYEDRFPTFVLHLVSDEGEASALALARH